MKYFKDPLYWCLMPPFFTLALLLFIYLPDVHKVYSSILAAILFWVSYYGWKSYAKKRALK